VEHIESGYWPFTQPVHLCFDSLADKPLSVEELCATKEIARRPAEALLSVSTSLGLMSLREGKCSLTFTPFSNGLSRGAIARRRLTPIVDWATIEKTAKTL